MFTGNKVSSPLWLLQGDFQINQSILTFIFLLLSSFSGSISGVIVGTEKLKARGVLVAPEWPRSSNCMLFLLVTLHIMYFDKYNIGILSKTS